MSEIEINPSAKGDLLKIINKDNEKQAEILKKPSAQGVFVRTINIALPSAQGDFVENYQKRKKKTSRNS